MPGSIGCGQAALAGTVCVDDADLVAVLGAKELADIDDLAARPAGGRWRRRVFGGRLRGGREGGDGWKNNGRRRGPRAEIHASGQDQPPQPGHTAYQNDKADRKELYKGKVTESGHFLALWRDFRSASCGRSVCH